MMDGMDKSAKDGLEPLESLLRARGTPADPRDGFEDELLDRLLERRRRNRTAPGGGRLRRVWRPVAAAAACLLAAAGLWWLAAGRTANAAADFAQVLRHVREASSVSYNLRISSPGRPDRTARVIMAVPGKARVSWANGRVQVMNFLTGKQLAIDPAKKMARTVAIPIEKELSDPLEDLRTCGENAGRYIGPARLAGRPVEIFEVSAGHTTMKVWAQSDSGLPIRIEMFSGNMAEKTMASDFRWNDPIPESMFAFDVPEGFTLERLDEPPTERDLVETLRICARINHGEFPAAMDVGTVFHLVTGGSGATRPDLGLPAAITAEEDDQARAEYRACLRGLAFIERAGQNHSWQYDGRGARLGDAVRPICWWKVPGRAEYRVVYGNLEVAGVASTLPADDGPGKIETPEKTE